MRLRLALGMAAALAIGAAPSGAVESGVVQIVPKFGANETLTIEVRNLSKQTVRWRRTEMEFNAQGTVRCTLEAPGTLEIAPAEMTLVTLAHNSEVLACLRRANAAPALRLAAPYVIVDRGLSSSELRSMTPAHVRLHNVTVNFEFFAGKTPVRSSMNWQFPVE